MNIYTNDMKTVEDWAEYHRYVSKLIEMASKGLESSLNILRNIDVHLLDKNQQAILVAVCRSQNPSFLDMENLLSIKFMKPLDKSLRISRYNFGMAQEYKKMNILYF